MRGPIQHLLSSSRCLAYQAVSPHSLVCQPPDSTAQRDNEETPPRFAKISSRDGCHLFTIEMINFAVKHGLVGKQIVLGMIATSTP